MAAALAVLWAAVPSLPNMWLWGANLQAFLPAGWLLWLLLALAFVPPVNAWMSRALEELGRWLARGWVALLAVAAIAALVVWALDDRTWFIGDFIIRRGNPGWVNFQRNFEQSLPLESVLFNRVPLLLRSLVADPLVVDRTLGALAAAALGIAGVVFGRRMAKPGAGVVVAALMLALGGYLVVFTGLGKPAALLCAATAWIALLALRACDSRRHLGWLGGVLALALLLHRSSVLLLPGWLVAVVVSWRVARRAPAERQRLGWLTAIFAALPLVALAIVGPRVLQLAVDFDIPHHLVGPSLGGFGRRGIASEELIRLADVANLFLLMTPLLFPALVAGGGRAAALVREGRFAVLAALALPWVVAVAVLRPQQGVFRDLDVFAPGMVAAQALAAYLLLDYLGRRARGPRLAAILALACAVPTLEALLIAHEPRHGLQRVAAYVAEAPARPPEVQARTWDFVALRAFQGGDWPLAATACERSVAQAPNPRLFIMLGIARSYVGDHAGARAAFSSALARNPDDPLPWVGLAGSAAYLGDRALADSCLARVRAFSADPRKAAAIERFLATYPRVMPAGS